MFSTSSISATVRHICLKTKVTIFFSTDCTKDQDLFIRTRCYWFECLLALLSISFFTYALSLPWGYIKTRSAQHPSQTQCCKWTSADGMCVSNFSKNISITWSWKYWNGLAPELMSTANTTHYLTPGGGRAGWTTEETYTCLHFLEELGKTQTVDLTRLINESFTNI